MNKNKVKKYLSLFFENNGKYHNFDKRFFETENSTFLDCKYCPMFQNNIEEEILKDCNYKITFKDGCSSFFLKYILDDDGKYYYLVTGTCINVINKLYKFYKEIIVNKLMEIE